MPLLALSNSCPQYLLFQIIILRYILLFYRTLVREEFLDSLIDLDFSSLRDI